MHAHRFLLVGSLQLCQGLGEAVSLDQLLHGHEHAPALGVGDQLPHLSASEIWADMGST